MLVEHEKKHCQGQLHLKQRLLKPELIKNDAFVDHVVTPPNLPSFSNTYVHGVAVARQRGGGRAPGASATETVF